MESNTLSPAPILSERGRKPVSRWRRGIGLQAFLAMLLWLAAAAQTFAQALPALSPGAASVLVNADGTLTVAQAILNRGTVPATNFKISRVTLNNANPLSPTLPLSLPNVAPGNAANLNLKFTNSYTPGQVLALRVTATFTGGTAGFTSRLVVPQAVPIPAISPNGGVFSQTVNVTLTDAQAGASIFYTKDGSDPTPSSIRYVAPFPLAASATIKAKAFAFGLPSSATAFATLIITPPPPGPAPVVALTTPTNGSTLGAPTVVTGTVSSAALAAWELDYELIGTPGVVWVPFASGTVAGNVQGSFDPTRAVDGTYMIRLLATDTAGQQSQTAISVMVTGHQKIGAFTVTYNDLTVPAAGVPISISRTYDSRSKGTGDFGVGWSLSLSNIRLQTNGPLSDGWTQDVQAGFFPVYILRATRPHTVTVTLPDETVYCFTAALSPNRSTLFPFFVVDNPTNLIFQPQTGTNAQLAVTDGGSVGPDSTTGPFTLLDNGTFTTYQPSGYKLTLHNGTAIFISASQVLQSIQDARGNTLTFTTNGIQSSSGQSVTFQRDGQGRISRITDPNGKFITYQTDGFGNLSAVTDRNGNTTAYDYDFVHNLTGIHDPRGVMPIRNFYDEQGRLSYTIDATGRKTVYSHNLGGSQEIITDRLGNQRVLGYDTLGNIVSDTRYLSDNGALRPVTLTRTFSDPSNPLRKTSVTDPLGNTTKYTYSSLGDLLTVEDALHRKLTYTYNTFGQVLTETGPDNSVTTNTYDAGGRLTSTTDPRSHTTIYAYNPNGTLASKQDAKGNVTTYAYDAKYRVASSKDGRGNVTAFGYDDNGNLTTQTQTRINTKTGLTETLVTQLVYDSDGNLIQKTYPDGSSTQTAYNAIGQVDHTTDELGRSTTYTYDIYGHKTLTQYPDGSVEQTLYDALGHPTQTIDRAGRVTSTTYDALGRAVETDLLAPNGSVLSAAKSTYDDAGHVLMETDANGNTVMSAYDAVGNLISSSDALNHATVYTYDSYNNLDSATDPLNHTTNYGYDIGGNGTSRTLPGGVGYQTAYDELNRVSSQTDPDNRATRFAYDANGDLTGVIDSGGNSTAYAYDEIGNRIAQQDANGHVTKFDYDSRRRVIQRTLPSGKAESFTYDKAGNRITATDFNGFTTSYAYDGLNRLLTKTPDMRLGQPVVSYSYYADGKRRTATRGTFTTTYQYDASGRMAQIASPSGTIGFAYDARGNRASVSTPSGTVRYAYDKNNRLTAVTHPDSKQTIYTYDAAGHLQTRLRPNGVATSYAYRADNRLTDISDASLTGTLSAFHYTVDPAGLRTGYTDQAGNTASYTYGSSGQLTQEIGPAGTISYAYDPVGNRKTKTANGQAFAYSYDVDDRLLNVTGPGQNTNYAYDANGNLTQAGLLPLTYDFENHLLSSGTTAYGYDADGNRISQNSGGSSTSYLVDTNRLFGEVLEERDSGNNLLARYDYGDRLLRMDRSSGVYYYLYDGIGSTRALADGGGSVAARYDYDAFGNPTQPVSALNRHTFNGQQYDADGLYYLRARYYDPMAGRFLSQDPFQGDITRPASLHRYAYVSNDPVNRFDPGGLQDLAEELAVVDIIGAEASFSVPVLNVAGENVVYQVFNEAGEVVYVGITRRFAAREAAHLASERFAELIVEIRPLLAGLTRAEARIVEQTLIEYYGGAVAGEAGGLLNIINSIALSNPLYDLVLAGDGIEILEAIGFFL